MDTRGRPAFQGAGRRGGKREGEGDSGDERLVPLAELLGDTRAAGLQLHRVFRSGFTPDFLPASLAGVWRWVGRLAGFVRFQVEHGDGQA